jgi:NADH dehydrogenase
VATKRQENRPQVVIVGGGFAGLFAVRALKHAPVDVTLIDRAEHHVFQPLLYQCATGILSEGQIASPHRQLLRSLRNVEFVLAKLVDFDVTNKVVVAERPRGGRAQFAYDYLILAAGVQQSYFGHDEYAEFAPGMKTITDALAIRQRIFGAFEIAESATDPAERKRWLTFALVGAGPTGVELAGQVREIANLTLRQEYRHINPGDATVLLFDGGDKPLAAMGDALAAKATSALKREGVVLHLRSLVTDVNQHGLLVRDAAGGVTHYDAATVLWTAGVEAPDVARRLAAATGAETDRGGRIHVGRTCSVPSHPEIYVVGDTMHLDNLPGMAEVAMQSGHYVGKRIRRRVEGKPTDKDFRYRDLGSAAYIRRGYAVVSAGRLHFGGFLGWLAWLFIHLTFLTGYRNRLTTMLTWISAFSREIRRERVYQVEQLQRLRDVYSAAIELDDASSKPTQVRAP